MIIVGIDPGGTTGTCVWHGREDAYFFAQHTTEDGAGYARLINWLMDWKTRANSDSEWTFQVVLERFNFRLNERDRTKIDYTAPEVIGAVKTWCATYTVSLELQMAAEGKAFWTDEKIKKIGLWKSGQRHAMDALRHVLQYRVFTLKDQSLLMKLRPQDQLYIS